MKGLHEKAMLASLNISQWSARRHDKNVTAKVASDYGTSDKAGRFNKCLIDPDALKPIQQKATEARTYYYSNTLPWNDDGQRILTAAHYLEFMGKLDDLNREFRKLVTEFSDDYPQLVQQARLMLNGMFRPEDYPDMEAIKGKFSFAVNINPLPMAEDFRVTLNDEERERIQEDIKARTENAIADAMKDLYRRLAECLNHMVDKLGDPKAIFRDTLTGNLADLVNLLPKLNLTSDPQLETIRREIETRLLDFEPETLRKAPMVRKQVAQDAAAILDMMKGYC